MIRHFLLLFLCMTGPLFAQLTQPEPGYYRNNRERFNAYVFRTYTDPQRIAWLLADSAMETWSKDPCQWDRSGASYSMRVASGWGRRIVRNTAQFGFETVLREDSRYRPSGSRQFRKRILYAIGHSVTAYGPDGSLGPAYGRMAAGVVAATVSSTWHPRPIGAGALLSGVGQSAIDRAGNNLLTEFTPDLKNFGKTVWDRFRK